MNRRTARTKAVQALFQIDVSQTEPRDAIQNVLDEDEVPDGFLNSLVHGTAEHLDDIDPFIEKHLDHWTMDRIGNVDRNILRMAVYELKEMKDIPRNVTLNEAVEAAKLFGGEESGRFVNGVLASMDLKEENDDGGNH